MSSKFTKEFSSQKFVDAFGKEFSKHEVLWRPQPNWDPDKIQSAKHKAHVAMAKELLLPVNNIVELLELFPTICLGLMNHYGGKDASQQPCWLRHLAEKSEMLKTAEQNEAVSACSWADLIQELTASMKASISGYRLDQVQWLRGPGAVMEFATKHGIEVADVLPVWRGINKVCLLKLRALQDCGDRPQDLPASFRMERHEWEVTDLALLHDRNLKIVHLSDLSTGRKHSSLVLLFQLIVAARELYELDEEHKTNSGHGDEDVVERRVNDEQNVSALGTDDEIGKSCVKRVEALDRDATNTQNEQTEVHGADSENQYSSLNIKQEDPTRVAGELETSAHQLHTVLDLDIDIKEDVSSDCSDDELVIECDDEDDDEKHISSGGIEEVNDEKESDNVQKDLNNGGNGNYWYESIVAGHGGRERVVWSMVYTEFIKRGRSGSLVSLQRGWLELQRRARRDLLAAWSNKDSDPVMHPLILVLAHRFPEITRDELPTWRQLVEERRVVLESDVTDIIRKFQQNGKTLLKINENLSDSDLVKEFYDRELKNILKESNVKNEHSFKINEGSSQNKGNFDINNSINHVLEKIDPSKAKVSIVFDDDSDHDVGNIGDESASTVEAVLISDRSEDNEQTVIFSQTDTMNAPIDDIKKEIEDDPQDIPTDAPQNEMNNIIDNNILNKDNYNKSDSESKIELDLHQTETEEVQAGTETGTEEVEEEERTDTLSPEIDDKLVKMAHVVITPIEHLKEWKKYSKDGSIRCKKFSVRKFSKPLRITSEQLEKCKPYIKSFLPDTNHHAVGSDDDDDKEIDSSNEKLMLEFEDDRNVPDIEATITVKKFLDLYHLPEQLKRERIQLTRKLKLSRTYYTSNFWKTERNIELMKLCKPVLLKLSKNLPRVAKRVELSNINEVRRINGALLTAQVSPIKADAGSNLQGSRSTEDTTAIIRTARQTNNSLSSSMFSSELRNLLINYTQSRNRKEEAEGENSTGAESVPNIKAIGDSLMDSIIGAMRLAERNNVPCNISDLPLFYCPDPDSSAISDLADENVPNKDPTAEALHPDLPEDHSISETKSNKDIAVLTEFDNNKRIYDPAQESAIGLKEAITEHVLTEGHDNNDMMNAKVMNGDDMRAMIQDLAAKAGTQFDRDDDLMMKKFLKSYGCRFAQHRRRLKRDALHLTKFLPQYSAIATEPTRRRCKENNTKDKDKLIIMMNNFNLRKDKCSKTKCVDQGCNTDFGNVIVNGTNLAIHERGSNSNKEQASIKNIERSSNRTSEMKDVEKKKMVKRGGNKSQTVAGEDKPLPDEYQEWQRQKTMSLKYFTINGIVSKSTTKNRTDKQTDKRKGVSKVNENQTNGKVRVNLKRKMNNTDVAKRAKLDDIINISDSDSDAQAVGETYGTTTTRGKTTETVDDVTAVNSEGIRNNRSFVLMNNNAVLNLSKKTPEVSLELRAETIISRSQALLDAKCSPVTDKDVIEIDNSEDETNRDEAAGRGDASRVVKQARVSDKVTEGSSSTSTSQNVMSGRAVGCPQLALLLLQPQIYVYLPTAK